MNESDETTDDQDQEDQTSVTDTNAQGDESVTDANAQSSSQDSNGSGDQESSDASTSTNSDTQSDDTDSSDNADSEEAKELQAITARGEEQRKRLANRLAQQGRERVATERELETERQKREQLEAENRRLRSQQSSNGGQDNANRDTDGADDDDDETDTSTSTNTGPNERETKLEAENRILRQQLTDAEAEEGGFYEEFSDDPATAQIQVAHNMKVLREALISQGDAEQNRQEREVHREFVTLYTAQGIDQETAEQLVALDIQALEADAVQDKLKIQQDGKKLYADAMSKSDIRQQRQDDARKQQLQDRTNTATNGSSQGSDVVADVLPVEAELKNMESMDYDQMMDHIEQLEKDHGAEFVESILQRI